MSEKNPFNPENKPLNKSNTKNNTLKNNVQEKKLFIKNNKSVKVSDGEEKNKELDNHISSILKKDNSSLFNTFQNSSFMDFNKPLNKNQETNPSNLNMDKITMDSHKSKNILKNNSHSNSNFNSNNQNNFYKKPLNNFGGNQNNDVKSYQDKQLEQLEKVMEKKDNPDLFNKNIFNQSFYDLNKNNNNLNQESTENKRSNYGSTNPNRNNYGSNDGQNRPPYNNTNSSRPSFTNNNTNSPRPPYNNTNSPRPPYNNTNSSRPFNSNFGGNRPFRRDGRPDYNRDRNDYNNPYKTTEQVKDIDKDNKDYQKVMNKYIGNKHKNKDEVYKDEYTSILKTTNFFQEYSDDQDKNRIQNILKTINENSEVITTNVEEKIIIKENKPMLTIIPNNDDRWFSKGNKNKKQSNFQFPLLMIDKPMTFKNLALKLNLTEKNLYKYLKQHNLHSLKNQKIISIEELIIVAEDLKISYEILDDFTNYLSKNIYSKYTKNLPGSPIIAIVGHIDHGKTSLIESLTKKNLCSKEAGAITQKVASYSIEYKNRYIRLIDTPGHSVFSTARNLAIEICDIVILIVSANEGVQTQTIDAIKFLQSNNIPFFTVITKIDLNSKYEKIYNELIRYNVVPVNMGGEIDIMAVSSKTGENINNVLEYIINYSDMINLHSDIENDGWGYVLESWKDKMGIKASIIMKQGAIKTGDTIFFNNNTTIKIRNITVNGQKCIQSNMYYTMEIEGLDEYVNPNEKFWIINNKNTMEEMEDLWIKDNQPLEVEIIPKIKKEKVIGAKKRRKKKNNVIIVKEPVDENNKVMNIIISTRSYNEINAIKKGLETMAEEGKIANYKILTTMLGVPNAIDIEMLQKFNGILIAFNIDINQGILNQLKEKKITVFYDNIIYNIINQLEEYYNNQYNSEDILEEAGEAEIVAIFKVHKKFIAGCIVRKGLIIRNQKIQLMRAGKLMGEGKIESLKNESNDIKEAKNNQECGIYCPEITEKYQLQDRVICWRTKRVVKTKDGKIISEKYV